MKLLKFIHAKMIIYCHLAFFAIAMVACNSQNNSGSKSGNAQPTLKPWEFSLDSNYALKNTDKFAWELFRAVNWPADTINFSADTTKQFGDSGWVVWQTWKTAPEVYLSDGSAPTKWLQKHFSIRNSEDYSKFSVKSRLSDIRKDPTFGIEEVVMNQSTYDYVVQNQLYNLNGQLAIYNSNKGIKFPNSSMELKVKWRKIPNTPYAKARYHWQYIYVTDGNKVRLELYGMVSMHITSKVTSNWVWATFEHIDNRSQTHPGDDGWCLNSKDKFACSEPPYDCEMAPTNFGLEGTKWEYYRLRGTQTTYNDPAGKPVLLANSNVERGFQLSSSCMTCHSLATIGPLDTSGNMQRANFIKSLMLENGVMFGGKAYVGSPDTSLYRLSNSQVLKMGDFVWSLSRAAMYKPSEKSIKK